MKTFHLVMNIPSPYRIPATRELWHQLQAKGISMFANYMSDMSRGHDERPLSWRNPVIDYPHRYWRDYGFGCHHFNPGLIMYLRKVKPDYMLVGSPFDTITGLIASGWCPATVKCCGTEGNTKTPGKMNGVRGWLKRWAFSKYQFVKLPGHDSIRYIQMHQRLTKRRMPTPILSPNLVESDRFKPRDQWNQDEIADIRHQLHGDEQTRLCIIPAKLYPQKGLVEFLSLVEPDWLNGWHINIFGEGPLRAEIEAVLAERGLSDKVNIWNFADYQDMPKFYAASDLFVLPSVSDPNPLTVVEAVNSGLAMAVTARAGNVEEAVDEPRNGWVLQVDDRNVFKKQLEQIFSTQLGQLYEMGTITFKDMAPFWDVTKGIADFVAGLGIK